MRYLALENFAIADRRMGGIERWYLKSPKDIKMIIPDAVKTCVVYLGKDYGDGKELDIRYGGTGFFVAIH